MDGLNKKTFIIKKNVKMKKVYPFQNLGGVSVVESNSSKFVIKQKGSCIGYVVVWLQNMLNGSNPMFCPCYALGQMLAGQAGQQAIDLEFMVTETCKKKYLIATLTDFGNNNLINNIQKISMEQGYYLIDYGGNGHIVGMANTGEKWYYFDPNDGLYDTDKQETFFHHVCSDVLDFYSKSKQEITVFKVRKFSQEEMLEFSYHFK